MVLHGFFPRRHRATLLLLAALLLTLASSTAQPRTGHIRRLSPLRHPRRLRFALIDVGIQLSQVPSLMDFAAMRHFETACQLFLLQELTADLHTNITDIKVTVMAQTLGNSIYGNENQQSDGALLPNTK